MSLQFDLEMARIETRSDDVADSISLLTLRQNNGVAGLALCAHAPWSQFAPKYRQYVVPEDASRRWRLCMSTGDVQMI